MRSLGPEAGVATEGRPDGFLNEGESWDRGVATKGWCREQWKWTIDGQLSHARLRRYCQAGAERANANPANLLRLAPSYGLQAPPTYPHASLRSWPHGRTILDLESRLSMKLVLPSVADTKEHLIEDKGLASRSILIGHRPVHPVSARLSHL